MAATSTIVDAWLEPLPGDACGENLEYDDSFREMEQAAAGRPSNQFDEGKPPDWRSALAHTQSLFERTRDLRVAICWARARVHLDGVATLPEGLRLIEGLVSRFWEDLHPRPEDGDAYARINALSSMDKAGGMLTDVRESPVFADRSIGEVRGRDIETALGLLEARAGEAPPGRASIEQMIGAAAANAPWLKEFPKEALTRLESIQQTMREHVGFAAAPEFGALTGVLKAFHQVMPKDKAADADAPAEVGGTGSPAASGSFRRTEWAGLSGIIDTRNDALRAIDMICDFLERTEPTNPAQMLLRRARKLVDKNFVELIVELAPEALNEVAKLMGLSADELSTLRQQMMAR